MLKNIYSIGGSLLLNSQSAISVHGQNMANASTPGYRRRTVDMASKPYLDFYGHTFGTGVEINRLRRHFDEFLARQQENKSGESSMWEAVRGNLGAMDVLFKDDATKGLTKAMTDFWNQWQVLSENPDQDAARTSLLGKATTLAEILRSKEADMQRQVALMDKSIAQETERMNRLMNRLAEINEQIVGESGATDLADARDKIIEEMSGIASIKTILRENGQATVSLAGGQTLVDGNHAYVLKYEGPKTTRHLMDASSFEDTIHYKGNGIHEYTIECVTPGPADGSAGSATFRVSLDGGKTWLSNPDGTPKTFTANGPGNEIKIGDVSVWFGKKDDSGAAPTTDLTKGDKFIIRPKKNLFWYKNSATEEDVTPYEGNEKKLTGGSLAGLLKARDMHVARYGKKLDALAKSLIWEVNYAHSQGAGSKHLTTTLGTYKADHSDRPLATTDLPFASRLKAGNFSIAIYDKANGKHLSTKPVDFSSIVPPGVAAFDPAVHSLDHVAQAITATYGPEVSASVEDGKLRLSSANNRTFSFAGDTSGLLAGLGLNTFFQGSSCSAIKVNDAVKGDISRICAGHVNGAGEVNPGDNTVAGKLAGLSTFKATFSLEGGDSTATFQEFLSDLIAEVGSDYASADSAADSAKVQLKFLNDRQEEVSGVNVKEEMIKLKQYQQHFQSASKLIQIANEMYDTLLSLK